MKAGNSLQVEKKEVEENLRKMISKKSRGRLKLLDKLAVVITRRVGSMNFFLLIFFWTICWLGYNTLMPKSARFDPFPAFVLWLFISNVIQILLMPLLLVGQNIQGADAEKRAKADFEINVKAELQNEIIIAQLEENEKILKHILKQLKLTKEDT